MDNARSFYAQNTLIIAKALIGQTLTVYHPTHTLAGIIIETEGYTQEDPACHAYQGKITPRNTPMFQTPGHLYIYFIYGMHYCLNIVTEPKNRGCAVLIRAIYPTKGQEIMQKNRGPKIPPNQLTNGPAKLVQALNIPKTWNQQDILNNNSPLKITDTRPNYPLNIQETPRIGITKAQHLNWRYLLTNNLDTQEQ